MRCLSIFVSLFLTVFPSAQIPTGHYVVLTATPAGGSALLDVDPTTGIVRALPGFSLDGLPPLACTWDPVARHTIVAVRSPIGSIVARVDPRGGYERMLATLQEPVVAMQIEEDADVFVLTGGPNGAFWEVPRNGGAPVLLMPLPHATAAGIYKRQPIAWVAQSLPTSTAPSVTFVDPRLSSVLVPPITIPGLAGRRITGIFDLPTGAIRQVLTDDVGGIHLFEFTTTLRTLPVTPPLPAGATTALLFEASTTLDAIVLGDVRHPFVHRVPVFGGAPTAITLAGPLPGNPIGFDLVDSGAGGWFGNDCGGSFGSMSLLVQPGMPGFFEARRAPSSAAAIAVFGVSEQFAGVVALPYRMPGGCDLLVSTEITLPITTTAGGLARIDFAVPNTLPPGFAVYPQWLFPDPSTIASSAALLSQRSW